jgi:hypothetical protein
MIKNFIILTTLLGISFTAKAQLQELAEDNFIDMDCTQTGDCSSYTYGAILPPVVEEYNSESKSRSKRESGHVNAGSPEARRARQEAIQAYRENCEGRIRWTTGRSEGSESAACRHWHQVASTILQ